MSTTYYYTCCKDSVECPTKDPQGMHDAWKQAAAMKQLQASGAMDHVEGYGRSCSGAWDFIVAHADCATHGVRDGYGFEYSENGKRVCSHDEQRVQDGQVRCSRCHEKLDGFTKCPLCKAEQTLTKVCRECNHPLKHVSCRHCIDEFPWEDGLCKGSTDGEHRCMDSDLKRLLAYIQRDAK